MKYIAIILFLVSCNNNNQVDLPYFEDCRSIPKLPKKYFIELILDNGIITHNHDTVRTFENLKEINNQFIDSIASNYHVYSGRFTNYLLYIDTLESFKNVRLLINNLREQGESEVFFKTNDFNDSCCISIKLPPPKQILDNLNLSDYQDSLITIQIIDSQNISLNNKKTKTFDLKNHLDRIIRDQLALRIQSDPNAIFYRTLQIYNLVYSEIERMRNLISRNEYGINYDELLNNGKEYEYQLIQKKIRNKLYIDFDYLN